MNSEIASPEPSGNPTTISANANEPSRVEGLKDLFRKFSNKEDGENSDEGKPPVMLQFRGAHDKFQKRSPELTPTFDALFKAFNSELLINSAMFETADGQASLPYTSINVTEFARRIYKNPDLDDEKLNDIFLEQPQRPKRRYYMVGSHLIVRDAQFSYVEIAFHEFMKKLPGVLRDMEELKAPEDVEIVIPGAPTSMFGHVTEEFASRVHEAPTQTYGALHKEFIKEDLKKDYTDPGKASILLHGFSMGSSWCAETAKQLEEDGIQSRVLMDSPTGLHSKRERPTNRRMDIGFGVDAAAGLAAHPDVLYFILNEPLFWGKMTPYLERHNGYSVHLDPAQVKLKKEIIADTVSDLREGIPADESVHAVIRQGKKDLSMITVPFIIDAAKKQARVKINKAKTFAKTSLRNAFNKGRESSMSGDLSNSLGKDQLPGYTPRTFAIDSQHLYPFFRENELRRWESTTRLVDDLVKRGQIELPRSIVSDNPLPFHARITDRFKKTA